MSRSYWIIDLLCCLLSVVSSVTVLSQEQKLVYGVNPVRVHLNILDPIIL